jgi:16S rRNA (adenine1518-N6/adenine1519-N6)-dimethyltransferase
MAQTKQQIQAMLAGASTAPRHRFGQNFMIDRNLVALVAEAGQIAPSDLVIEVGPGTGTLTEELLSRSGNVVAVEIDRDLAALLRGHFAGRPGFGLIEGDALSGKHELNPRLLSLITEARSAGARVKLVANLPYNIASPLVIELLIAGVDLLAFTVQKEVALRLKAAPGTSDYGPLTVMAQLLADVKLERILPPQAFWPAPKVESALMVLRRRSQALSDPRQLGAFVAGLFSSRRKMLRKALQQMGVDDAEGILSQLGIFGQQRPEVLSPSAILALWQACGRT